MQPPHYCGNPLHDISSWLLAVLSELPTAWLWLRVTWQQWKARR